MKRWWVSWHQGGDDYRPVQWPLAKPLIAYWCSGHGEDSASLCLLAEADTAQEVDDAIMAYWPDRGEMRFFEERAAGWTPEPSRFPMRMP